ncbi:MAG TPA: DUF2934 domain-containing protein [Steroidobacteraceae bacterium]|nr:DUF2934 domain-containing protein [Steroidobacteraceae bacterium]
MSGTRKRDKDEALQGLAHRLWVQRGKPIGSPEIDWTRAEQLLSEIGESIKLVNAALEKVQQSGDAPNGIDKGSDGEPKSATESSPAVAKKTRTAKRTGKKSPRKTSSAKNLVAHSKTKSARKTDRKSTVLGASPQVRP